MKRIRNFAVWTFCFGVILLACAESNADDDRYLWQAGVSRKVITPDNSVWLAGYGTSRPPDGKLHDLWMKALALQAPDGHRVV